VSPCEWECGAFPLAWAWPRNQNNQASQLGDLIDTKTDGYYSRPLDLYQDRYSTLAASTHFGKITRDGLQTL